MKNCKFCNNENEDSFIFCSSCGKRIDGNKICSKCNKTIKENAKFCSFCGTRVDNKKECPSCHNEIDKNTDFCPFCGNKAKQKSTNTLNLTNTFNLTTKIILLSLSCLFVIGILLSFLTTTYNNITSKLYIYEFFTKDFFDLFYTKTDVIGTGLTSEYVIAYNTHLATMMVVAYLGILSTLATGIISIIKNALSISKSNQAPNYKLTISTGLCYFALTFGLTQSNTGLLTFNTTSNTISTSLSAMPIILIIISILSIISITVFNIIQNKISIITIVSIVLRSLSFIFSLWTLFLICSNGLSTIYGNITYGELLSTISNIKTLILYIFATLITLYTIYALFIKIYKITEKYTLKKLVNSIIHSSLIIILFILTIVLTSDIRNQSNALGITATITLSSGIITALIFTLISFGLDLTSFILTNKDNN